MTPSPPIAVTTARPAMLALLLLGLISAAAYFGEFALHLATDNGFIALTLLQSGIALLATHLALAVPRRSTMIIVIATGVIFRLILLFEPPLLSDDIYRYIWDGRIINHGFNPYLHVPADPALAHLQDPAIYAHVDKKTYAVTIYPPVAEAIFALVTRLSDTLIAMKLAMLAFEALALVATSSLLRSLDKNPLWITLWLWHPGPTWEIANSGHIDTIMIALVLAGFAFGAVPARNYRAAALMALGALAKPFGALWLASIWKPFDVKLPLFVLVLVALCYLPFAAAGMGVFGFWGTYLHEQGLDSGYGFYLVGLARRLGAPDLARQIYLAMGALALAGIAILPALRAGRTLAMQLRQAELLVITFLLLLSPVYPWYFILALPFMVLTGSWSAFAMFTTGFWLYTFNPDQFDFSYRWGCSYAIIVICAGVDLVRANSRAPMRMLAKVAP